MVTLESLRSQGWHLTLEGLNKLSENGNITDIKTITRKAYDVDLKEIGASVITSEINKATFGPVVLQIAKIRNISAPKSKPNSQAAPRMLKLVLTDGHSNCQGIELNSLPVLNLDKTIPGTKILISGAQILSGSVLLTPQNCKILGGHVNALVEKWEVSKMMPSHIRVTEDGPPPWVNFGQKIINNINSQGFKSLENKNKDNSKENSEFQVQRQDAIAEATQGAVKKVFGGGVKPPVFNNYQESNSSHQNNKEPRPPRQQKQKGKDKVEVEKIEKPSQRVSLFDFLEDKLSLTDTTQTKTTPINNNSNTKFSFNNEPSFSNQFNKVIDPQKYNKPNNSFHPKQSYKDQNKPRQPQNNFNAAYNRSNQDHFNNSNRQESNRQFYDDKFQKFHTQDNRYHQNDRPPRFQKQQRPDTTTNKFNNPNASNHFETRTKPNTNVFVDKLTNEMNNISLYNSKYENEKLHRPPNRTPTFSNQNREQNNKQWKWKVGDKCMAKYWEDDKFYNAVVTGITSKTCMVEFVEYGNYEEVLHCDCIPITSDKQDRQQIDRGSNNNVNSDNQQFAGSLEFRRGKNRPFTRAPNKTYGQNKYHES